MSAKKQPSNNPLSPLMEGKGLPAVSLITAEDRVRLDRSVTVILEHHFPGALTESNGGLRSVEIARLSGQGLTLDQLREAVESSSTLSLFSPQKVLILQHFEEMPTAVEKRLVEMLPRFHSAHALIILGIGVPKASPVLKHCAAAKTFVSLERPKGFDWKRWVERELRSAGIAEYEEKVVDEIERISEGSLDAAVAIVGHLSLYIEEQKATIKDLRQLFSHRTLPGEFDILDSLTSGRTFEAERMARSLLDSSKSPFLFTALLGRMFTNYLLVKTLLSQGVPAAEVRTRLNIQPWAFQKMLQALQRYSLDRLAAAVKALARADSLLKNRSLGEEFVISELLLALSPLPRASR